MESEWKSPNTIIGTAATGEYYFPRNTIIEEIWKELDKGNFVLIAAPRRVGKTSIMKDLESNPRKGYLVKFENIQAVSSETELYKTLYKLLIGCLGLKHKATSWFRKYLQTKEITELDPSTGKFKIGNKTFSYREEITFLLKEFEEENDKVVLLIDELPEVLHNLNKKGKQEEAKAILKQLRAWRQANYKNLQFVFAGSIGIHYVVKSIEGRTSDLNDLRQVSCEPLTNIQSNEYIVWATKEATIKYDEIKMKYLKDKIKAYFTPFFLNLMLEEIDRIARKRAINEVTTGDIDLAFDNVVKKNDHFEDWKKRLKDYLPKVDYNLVNEVLIFIAHKNKISIQKMHDLAIKHNKTDDYMELVSELENDGYIVEEESNYVFISPFLKAYWKRNNPIYDAR